MMTRKAVSLIGGMVVALALMIVPAQAGEQYQGTWMTFDQPVEVPGMTLSPGTYWFRILDNKNDGVRNVVQVYDSDKEHIANITAIPLKSEDAIDGVVEHYYTKLEFVQRDDRAVLLSWTYPNSFFGHEFVYQGQERRMLDEEPVITAVLTDEIGVYSGQIDLPLAANLLSVKVEAEEGD
jgi:hypothetical protein